MLFRSLERAGDPFEVQPGAGDPFEVEAVDGAGAEVQSVDGVGEAMPVTADGGVAPVLGALDDLDHDIARAIATAVVDKLATLVAPPMLPLVAEEVVRIMMAVPGRGAEGAANGNANGTGSANGHANGEGPAAAHRSDPTGSLPSN